MDPRYWTPVVALNPYIDDTSPVGFGRRRRERQHFDVVYGLVTLQPDAPYGRVGLQRRARHMAGKDNFVSVQLKLKIVKDAELGQHDQFMPDFFLEAGDPSFFGAVLTVPCAKGTTRRRRVLASDCESLFISILCHYTSWMSNLWVTGFEVVFRGSGA